MISSLRSRVDKAIKERSGEVVLGLFSFLLRNHKDRCGCDYCVELDRYDGLLSRQRVLRKQMEADTELHRGLVSHIRPSVASIEAEVIRSRARLDATKSSLSGLPVSLIP